jgi:hypothetical protein
MLPFAGDFTHRCITSNNSQPIIYHRPPGKAQYLPQEEGPRRTAFLHAQHPKNDLSLLPRREAALPLTASHLDIVPLLKAGSPWEPELRILHDRRKDLELWAVAFSRKIHIGSLNESYHGFSDCKQYIIRPGAVSTLATSLPQL